MERRIEISAGSVKMEAKLNDSKTADLIYNALPIEAKANRWGDEIYFSIPVRAGFKSAPTENPKEIVDAGDLAYWPPGNAFCIFFGPTPVSRGSEIKPASAVNPIGKLLGDSKLFKQVKDQTKITITKKSA
jgi:hypothetical protein